MPCLRHSEQRPDSPSGERENYFEFHGKYVASNLYRITYTSPCPVRLKMIEEYAKIGHILSTECPFYLVPEFGKYIALSTGCSFYSVPQFGKYIALSTGCQFYSVPQFGKYIALSTGCPFYSVPQFGKYIALSTGCPFCSVPQFGSTRSLYPAVI